jgi:hypothetical protein
MSTLPAYEISYDASALKSLSNLEPREQLEAVQVLADLGTHLAHHPERIYRNGNNQTVYRHPKPSVRVTYNLDPERRVAECSHITVTSFPPATAFISYCHKNKKYKDEFRLYMRSLEEELELIEFWDDNKIRSGDEWNAQIEEALQSSEEAILLVSEEFLNSPYIKTNELPVLEARFKAGQVRVHWVHLEEAVYENLWFAKIEALCSPQPPLLALRRAKRRAALKGVCIKLRDHLLRRLSEKVPTT